MNDSPGANHNVARTARDGPRGAGAEPRMGGVMMRGPYEWQVATRYLRSTHRRGFVSFVALTSIIGLTLGIAVLIVVLSVMNGFERELRTRMLSVTSHATLEGLDGALPDWRAAQTAALREPGV